MKKELLDALKAKFVGVSENVLGRVADKLAKTVTTAEQVASAVEVVTFQQVLDSYGDSRATEAQQTAVKNYESKYGLKDGAIVDTGGAATPPSIPPTTPPIAGVDNETPTWAQALLDANKALTDRLNKMEGERTTANRRQQLNGIIEKLPEHLRKAYERTPVDNISEEEFTTLTTEISAEVEGIVKDTQQRGAVFGKPTVTGGNNTGNEQLTKEQEEAIAHRDSITKQGSQPF